MHGVATLTMAVVMAVAGAAQSAQQPAAHAAEMTDAFFASMMARHHQGGIEMARLEEKGGRSQEMKALAAKIRSGQQAELPKLQAFAKAHKPTETMAAHEAQLHKRHEPTIAKLKAAKGDALDKLFAEEMIKHHEEGLQMIEQTQFKDAELKKLADKIAEQQKQEIEQLRKLSTSTH